MKIKEKVIYPFLDILLNGFNYGFHVYTSWYLIKRSYAVLNAYLALVSLLMVIGIALQSYNAKLSAGVKISGTDLKLVNPFIIMGIPSILLIIFSPIIVPFLKGDFLSLIIISILLILHSVLSSGRGLMQGQGSFLKLNVSFYIEVIVKIAFLIIFMPRFPNIYIPLLSILLGYTIALVHLKFYVVTLKIRKLQLMGVKSFLKNKKIVVFILSQFFIYSYFSMDMILVNGLHQEFAPIYAIVQKLGMIQFFVGSSLMAVFLPELADNSIDNYEFERRWKRFLIILVIVLAFFQIFYNTVFKMILPYMFGEQYLSAGDWVPYGGVIFALLVIINFFIITLLAKNSRIFNVVLFAGLVLVSVGIIIARSISEVLLIEGIVYFVIALSLYGVILKEKKRWNII
ncbi:MAG: hypothetical protein OCD02_15670 [Spirochaetaceae bacterium]